ncbi:hypothetical protein CsSME_00030658 [Camellia sinensis var. sinensis]
MESRIGLIRLILVLGRDLLLQFLYHLLQFPVLVCTSPRFFEVLEPLTHQFDLISVLGDPLGSSGNGIQICLDQFRKRLSLTVASVGGGGGWFVDLGRIAGGGSAVGVSYRNDSVASARGRRVIRR